MEWKYLNQIITSDEYKNKGGLIKSCYEYESKYFDLKFSSFKEEGKMKTTKPIYILDFDEEEFEKISQNVLLNHTIEEGIVDHHYTYDFIDVEVLLLNTSNLVDLNMLLEILKNSSVEFTFVREENKTRLYIPNKHLNFVLTYSIIIL